MNGTRKLNENRLIKVLSTALYIAASQAYTSEVIETDMLECEPVPKDQWIQNKLYEWIGSVKNTEIVLSRRKK